MKARAPLLCLEEQLAIDFVHGHLIAEDVALVESHLEGCGDCRRLLLELARASGAAISTTAPELSGGSAIGVGATVSRYLITEPLGAGSMGIVYCAYDPKLHRRLAIKLLRHDRASSETGQQRLLREAQALASLAHPSVVAVHDVGTFGSQVFLAMEFCSGGTLREWLDSNANTRADIVDCFVMAGEGLAAAHEQGLVHRDFKPANVLLNSDGKPKVTDFGLAYAPLPSDEADLGSGAKLAQTITQTGALIGTPAYMAPEQLRGEPASQRSDQFSFCVALWEALSRKRPFAGASVKELLRSIEAQDLSDSEAAIPSRLRQVLRKGLSVDPAQRHESMSALLALVVRYTSPRRRVVTAAIAGVALLAAAAVYATPSQAQSPCTGAERHLNDSWSAERRKEIQTAFVGSSLPNAESLWRRVDDSMNQYAAGWASAHRQSCEATEVFGEQSSEIMELRMSCLQRHKDRFSSLSRLYATAASTELVGRSLAMVSELPSVALCADVAYLQARGTMPATAAMREAVLRFEEELAAIEAMESAGAYRLAEENSDALIAKARPQADPRRVPPGSRSSQGNPW